MKNPPPWPELHSPDPGWQGPPPWKRHRPPHWRRKRGWLFLSLFFVFGLMALLILAGMAAVAMLLVRGLGGYRETAVLVWLSGCSLALVLPMLALGIGRRAFRSIATPLAEVMAAADAVAEGDLTVRVTENGRHNQFAQLTRSFNRMTAELERADQQRRNLTADVAHELRTPLHIIQGNLEGLLDGVYEPTVDHIEATLEETHTLARLVNDLHTLSQAEAGQLPLRLEPVDLTELLTDVQTSFSGQAEAAQIALEVSFDGQPADLTIMADAGRLDQVLGNLVANALRHTPAGGEIRLTAVRQPNHIHLIVADTGEGIPTKDLPYIFNRFWRGNSARTRADGIGGGLGLAIAKQLIEAHHGQIDVTSAPGQGAQFTISLPL
ncbi:MAG: HAMP domain-containing protein [Chloroflexi bacterium]|nr:HAMP domain-containing protein [Chloroflexota bacterium]MBP7043243.1 HAMP domain-containing protein [Chloroflexota bacterium]